MVLMLEINANFATFTQPRAREYAASFPYPPPATVYGLLLSLVGECDRAVHQGVRLAIGMVSQPRSVMLTRSKKLEQEPRSTTVLRKVRRLKKTDLNHPSNSRPDFQEVLCGIDFVVGVDSQGDRNDLEARIVNALRHPETVDRFGGLSLGESRDLVNDIRILEELPEAARWLVVSRRGQTLPVWVNYRGARGTRWACFEEGAFGDRAFCAIAPAD
ncbi:MAG: type I-MYXAN CRISPR-associated protein Cas5/Cmx5/DevS [Cyanobacteria bacterium P01_E01_bin.42]